MRRNIKLIIVDFYGVMLLGSYVDTCLWISKKYKIPYKKCYDVVYHKYFSHAALGELTERESFELPARELSLKETWQQLRKRHIDFQRINKSVLDLCRKLQSRGYVILLLSKNTPEQFDDALTREHIRWYFKNIINTLDLKLPKASKETMQYVLKRFKIKPEEAVMIDDQDFNLPEAKKLGVHTILYKNFGQMKKELQEMVAL